MHQRPVHNQAADQLEASGKSRSTLRSALVRPGRCFLAVVGLGFLLIATQLSKEYLRSFLRRCPGYWSATLSAQCTARLAEHGLHYGGVSYADPRSSLTWQSRRRRDIYAAMALDLQENGLHLGGLITQGLSQSDLFEIKMINGELEVVPLLHHLQAGYMDDDKDGTGSPFLGAIGKDSKAGRDDTADKDNGVDNLFVGDDSVAIHHVEDAYYEEKLDTGILVHRRNTTHKSRWGLNNTKGVGSGEGFGRLEGTGKVEGSARTARGAERMGLGASSEGRGTVWNSSGLTRPKINSEAVKADTGRQKSTWQMALDRLGLHRSATGGDTASQLFMAQQAGHGKVATPPFAVPLAGLADIKHLANSNKSKNGTAVEAERANAGTDRALSSTQAKISPRTKLGGKRRGPPGGIVAAQANTQSEVPVRAVVLPLSDQRAAMHIWETLRRHLVQAVPESEVWFQDLGIYHATIFHASSHQMPVPASHLEVLEEAAAVHRVADQTCPIKAVVDRVVITSTGVVVACWQVVTGGGEPATLRSNLRDALPNAPPPAGQMVKAETILHTTLARLLAPMNAAQNGLPTVDTTITLALASQLTEELCGLGATFSHLWFVEEKDLLALALQGDFSHTPATLTCPKRHSVLRKYTS